MNTAWQKQTSDAVTWNDVEIDTDNETIKTRPID
jgi:hypothetical protein